MSNFGFYPNEERNWQFHFQLLVIVILILVFSDPGNLNLPLINIFSLAFFFYQLNPYSKAASIKRAILELYAYDNDNPFKSYDERRNPNIQEISCKRYFRSYTKWPPWNYLSGFSVKIVFKKNSDRDVGILFDNKLNWWWAGLLPELPQRPYKTIDKDTGNIIVQFDLSENRTTVLFRKFIEWLVIINSIFIGYKLSSGFILSPKTTYDFLFYTVVILTFEHFVRSIRRILKTTYDELSFETKDS